MKKFFVVVGNPPYQGTSGNKGRGNILWDKFVSKSDEELVEDGGYICLVHPSLWRKPKNKLGKHFFQNNLKYLEIHNETDGLKTFGAGTRYDWYILQKNEYSGKTTIKDQDECVFETDLQKLEFIPNCKFDLVKNLLAKDGEEKAEIIQDRTAYGADKLWISSSQDEEHPYPCVYAVHRDDKPIFKWSKVNNKGHFGIPKVIYGSGATGFWVDTEGVGMTQWASGIVDIPENLESIAKALRSKKFDELVKACAVSKAEVQTNVLRLFRKDFWKEF